MDFGFLLCYHPDFFVSVISNRSFKCPTLSEIISIQMTESYLQTGGRMPTKGCWHIKQDTYVKKLLCNSLSRDILNGSHSWDVFNVSELCC